MRTLTATLLALAAPNAALACGGFFCNQSAPVDQAGETIIFGVDHEADTVEMHVQVEYAGPADEFAWVIPVKGEPDVFLSHSSLFQSLPAALPTWFRIDGDDSTCDMFDSAVSAGGSPESASTWTSDDYGGVSILGNEQVGAYDVTTLAADDAEVLVAWLQDNGYDVPDALGDVLVPYVANDMNFLALKLRKGAADGELSPLGLRYEGKTPTVPIELTSIAASPDMPLIVYLFGDARAVPTNYLHVRLNPVAIDYWTGGANFDEVISLAADEAGGQAFATDLVAEAEDLQGLLYTDRMFDTAVLEGEEVAARFVESLPAAGFLGTDEVLSVLRRHVPVPDGFPSTEADFYNCPSCWADWYEGLRVDPDAMIAELVEVEVAPRIQAEALFTDHQLVTRLRSSISPVEMTVDPKFGFNPDLPRPDDISTLANTLLCNSMVSDPWSAKQRLDYPLGFSLTIPSSNELAEMGMTEFEFVQAVTPTSALIIEELGESGEGTILVDNRDALSDGLQGIDEAVPSSEEEQGGCGCSTSSPAGAVGLLPLLALAFRRRR